MTKLALAISVRCLFGLGGYDARELGELGVAYLRGLIDPLAMMLPFDVPGMPFRRLLRIAERFERRILAWIEQRHIGDGVDVLSMLIATGELDDAELAAQAAVFFIAGDETTACTLAWT